MYAEFFTECTVLLAAIYLIGQDPRRIIAKPAPVFLHNTFEFIVFALVVGIKTQVVYKGISIYYTYGYLCSKLGRRFGFSTYDWTNPWLGEAHYAIGNRMCFVVQHFFLLGIEFPDRLQPFC